MPLTTIWFLLWCWQSKVPVDQAMRFTELSEVTVRRWYARFRNNLPQEKLWDIRLEGAVQMDEMYRHGYAVLGAKEEGGKRRCVLKIVKKESVDRKDAVELITHCVRPGSILQTDGASIYKRIENWCLVEHRSEIHKKFEFALTSEIEGLWGNFTTFVRRMYHHVTAAKADLLLVEFQFRFSFPEYFTNTGSYAKHVFQLLKRIPQKRGRNASKILADFSRSKKVGFPIISGKKAYTFVPTC